MEQAGSQTEMHGCCQIWTQDSLFGYILGSELNVEVVCTTLYEYCRNKQRRKSHKYGSMEEQQQLNNLGQHQASCEPGQVHYATLCFVQVKEPRKILVYPSKEGASGQ